MMLMTHALMGAALGRIVRNRPLSFLLGVASHALGDVLPHQERALAMDGPLCAAALGLIAWRYGPASPECLGALGAITPDAEHLPTRLGFRSQDEEIFPTHGPYPQPWLHSMGCDPGDDVVQFGLIAASLAALSARNKETIPEEG